MDVVADVSMPYSGFSDGAFFEEDKIAEIVEYLLEQVENRIGKRIKKRIYVAVPGEFVRVDIKRYKEQFARPRQVVAQDWARLVDKAEMASNTSDYANINTTIVSCESDSYRPINIGNTDDMVTRSITATISCVMCDRHFIDIFDSIFDSLGIKECKYISESLGEAMYLTTKKEREKGVLLCDIGYLTTTVMLVKGGGILDMRSFSKGGAHIIADLVEVYDLDFKSAESLFEKINLKLELRGGEKYRFNMPEGMASLPMAEVNDVARYELDILVKYITKCIETFGEAVGEYMPIFYTGGGVIPCKGAIEYITRKIGLKFDVRTPSVVKYTYPWCSSMVAGLDMACKEEMESGLFKKFFNKIFGG